MSFYGGAGNSLTINLASQSVIWQWAAFGYTTMSLVHAGVRIGSSAALGAGTVLQIDASKTVASAGGAAWSGVLVDTSTLTLTGTTTTAVVSLVRFATPTITDVSACTVTKAATVTISGPPAAGGSVTITQALALNVEAGVVFLGNSTAPAGNPTSGIYLWSESGTLKTRNAAGTTITIN